MLLLISLIIILVLIIVSFFIYAAYQDCEYIKVLLPNIIGGLIAAFFVTASVDLILWWRGNRKKKQMKRVATKRLWREIKSLLAMFVQVWKASVKVKPSHLPDKYDDFLQGDYCESYKNFDLSTSAPIAPQRSWYKHFANVVNSFKGGVDRILDVYNYYLDAEFVTKIENVVRHEYMDFPDQLLGKEEVERSGGKKKRYIGDLSIKIEDLFTHLKVLLEAMRKEVGMDYSIAKNYYRDDCQPLWGSGYRDTINEGNPDFESIGTRK